MRFLLALLLSVQVSMAVAGPVASGVESRIRQVLGERFKGLAIRSVSSSPVEGVYEVFSGSQIGYITGDARYLFVNGNLVDLEKMANLTEQRMAELNRIVFGKLPLADAITVKKGNGSYVFAVFSDPDCPYCRALEAELAKPEFDNYTEYVFTFPLEMHAGAKEKAVSLWCAADRTRAWTGLMAGNVEPQKAECDNPVERNIRLGNDLGVNQTPTIYGSDGRPMQLPALLAAIRNQGK